MRKKQRGIGQQQDTLGSNQKTWLCAVTVICDDFRGGFAHATTFRPAGAYDYFAAIRRLQQRDDNAAAGGVQSTSRLYDPIGVFDATLYVANESYAGTMDTGTVLQAFDVATGTSKAQPSSLASGTNAIATSAGGRFVYLGTGTGIVVLDETTGKTTSYDASSSIASVAQTTGAKELFFSGGSSIFIFNDATGTPIRSLHVPNVGPISVDPDGAHLYVAPSATAVSAVSPVDGHVFWTAPLPGPLGSLAVDTSTDELFAPALEDRKTYIVYLKTGKYVGYILEPSVYETNEVQMLVQPNSRTIYLGSNYLQTITRYVVDARGVPQPKQTYHVSGVNGVPGNGLALDATGAHLFGMGLTSVFELSTASGQVGRTFPEPPNNGGFATTYVGIALSQ